MAMPQLVQIAPGVFPEAQQRAINDALARLTSVIGVNTTATLIRQSVAAGATSISIRVTMPNSVYTVSGCLVGSEGVHWQPTLTRSDLLTITFDAPVQPGSELRLVLQ
jgi:hypothetical protein